MGERGEGVSLQFGLAASSPAGPAHLRSPGTRRPGRARASRTRKNLMDHRAKAASFKKTRKAWKHRAKALSATESSRNKARAAPLPRKAVEAHNAKAVCLSCEGSGNTGQRQCLSREGTGSTQGKSSALAT